MLKKQFLVFNETLLDIFGNFVLNPLSNSVVLI